MKREFFRKLAIVAPVTLFVFSFYLEMNAQSSESFDIATFQSPKGWQRQSKNGAVIFTVSDQQKGTYAIITIYSSGTSTGSAKGNFDADWAEFVVGQFGVKGKPELEPVEKKDDWEIVSGGAVFENELGTSAAILRTYSGFGKTFSAVAIFNSQDHVPTIEAFASSLKLQKPEPGKQPQTVDNQSASQSPITQHFWKQSQNRRDIGGYAGYSSNTYQFKGNGTYIFSNVTFQNYTPKYYLENEEGTYKISGNKITITPKKAIFSSHKSKKEDPPIKSGNLGLTMVQYSFEFIDLHNNGRLSLLLSPVDGIETKRDGTFSFWLNGEKRNTYSYSAVNAAGELVP